MITFNTGNKIICVGRNYIDHAKELNNPIPEEPVLFMKPTCCVVSMDGEIEIPKNNGEVHHELELYAVIGKTTGNDSKSTHKKDSNYTITSIGLALDLTLRDIQKELKKQGLPWEKAKSFDGACPISKSVNIDSSTDLKTITFKLYKNDVLQQHGHTKDMIFPLDQLIDHISNYFSLNEGDIILSGTPSGVSQLTSGDRLRASLAINERIELTTETKVI